MDMIIAKLFSDYLSEQNIVTNNEYSALTKSAIEKENTLRSILTVEQTTSFEELFDITSQIHFLEVKDAFFSGCKLGAKATKELII